MLPIDVPSITAADIYSEYQDYYSASASYFQRCEEAFAFYRSRQWPKAWADALLARGQFPLSIGTIYAIIQGMESQLTAQQPTYDFVPQGYEDVSVARLHQKVGIYSWQKSNGQAEFAKAIRDFLICGKSAFYTYPDRFESEGRFRRLRPNSLLIDPATEHHLGDDASSYIIRQTLTRRQLKREMPLFTKEIDEAAPAMRDISYTDFVSPSYALNGGQVAVTLYTASGDVYRGTQRSTGSEDFIELFDRVAPVVARVYKVSHVRSGQIEYILEDDLQEWLSGVKDPDAWSIEQSFRKFHRISQSLSNKTLLFDGLVPVKFSPVTLMLNNHFDDPFPDGEVEYLKGLAMERNKRRSLNIYNMSTMGSHKLMFQDGSINELEWERKYALPGAMLKYNEGYEKPEVIPGLSTNPGIEGLEQQSTRDMYDVSGWYPSNQGDPRDSPRTHMQMLQLDENSARRLGRKLRTISDSLSRLGYTIFRYNQIFMTQEKVIRIALPDGTKEPMIVNADNGIERFNDLSIGEFDVQCRMGSTMPSSSVAKVGQALDMFDRNIYDDRAVLMATNDPQTEEILARRGMMQQIMAQNDQLKQSQSDMEGKLKNLGQTVEMLMRQLRVEKGTREIEGKVIEARAKIGAAVNEQQRQASEMGQAMQDEQRLLRERQGLEERGRALDQRESDSAIAELLRGSLGQFLMPPSSETGS